MNETTRADIAIIGTGPAGVSAAITARVRGKQVLLFGSKGLTTKMTKAHTIRNYPGLPDITGTDLADKPSGRDGRGDHREAGHDRLRHGQLLRHPDAGYYV